MFSANGVYDPNVTGTGHQPLGFDTMMLYYEQYTVHRSSMSVRCCGNGIQACNVLACLSPDTTTLVVPDVIENGLAVRKVVDGRGNGGNGTGNRIVTLSLSCDVAAYFGRKAGRTLNDDVTLSGTVAANPTEQVYFVLGQWGFGAFTDNTAVGLDVIIEYDVEFWEPRKVASQLQRARPINLDEKTLPDDLGAVTVRDWENLSPVRGCTIHLPEVVADPPVPNRNAGPGPVKEQKENRRVK